MRTRHALALVTAEIVVLGSAAQAADAASDFSHQIRAGLDGPAAGVLFAPRP